MALTTLFGSENQVVKIEQGRVHLGIAKTLPIEFPEASGLVFLRRKRARYGIALIFRELDSERVGQIVRADVPRLLLPSAPHVFVLCEVLESFAREREPCLALQASLDRRLYGLSREAAASQYPEPFHWKDRPVCEPHRPPHTVYDHGISADDDETRHRGGIRRIVEPARRNAVMWILAIDFRWKLPIHVSTSRLKRFNSGNSTSKIRDVNAQEDQIFTIFSQGLPLTPKWP